MKKWSILILVIVMCLTAAAGCARDYPTPTPSQSAGTGTPGPADGPDYAAYAKQNLERAVEYGKIIHDKYWNSSNQTSNLIPGQGAPFLWPYTEQVGMANEILSLLNPATDAEDYAFYRQYLEELLEGLRYYRVRKTEGYTTTDYGILSADAGSYAIYNSGRAGSKDSAGTDKNGIYFDDNIWVAKEFYNAYLNLGEEKYLKEAVNVLNWILGEGYEVAKSVRPFNGTANVAMNGIYWKWGAKSLHTGETDDNKNASLNACSSAPTAMMLVKLYNALEKAELTSVDAAKAAALRDRYLITAKRIFNFVYRVLLDENSNTIKDKVFIFQEEDGGLYLGTVDEQILPYNTGCMLTAGAELYADAMAKFEAGAANEQANAKSYASRTSAMAAGADVKFTNVNIVKGEYAYNKNSWFTSFLAEGFHDVYAFDERAEEYLEHMRSSLDYGWMNFRADDGLVCPAWVAGWSEFTNDGVSEENPRQILLQSANAHCYAMLADYYLDMAKKL